MALLLIDTNLLIVAVVAAVDRNQVERLGRTRGYTVEDALLLDGIVAEHDNILVTPHILTEVSNLLGKVEEPLLSAIRSRLSALIPTWCEVAEPSQDVVRDPFFHRFGITDAAIFRATGARVTVLTDDLPLYAALAHLGKRAINFTHVRDDSWRDALEWP